MDLYKEQTDVCFSIFKSITWHLWSCVYNCVVFCCFLINANKRFEKRSWEEPLKRLSRHCSCLQAVAGMNGKELNGRVLYVGRAQKRLERQSELKRKFEQIKQERLNRYQVIRFFHCDLIRDSCLVSIFIGCWFCVCVCLSFSASGCQPVCEKSGWWHRWRQAEKGVCTIWYNYQC